jgi:hypothetical protein
MAAGQTTPRTDPARARMFAGHTYRGITVSTMLRALLRSSRPVLIMTALVAVLGIGGTAYGAKVITGLDIRDGSITSVDLSRDTMFALHGSKGDKGVKGLKGLKGLKGMKGTKGLNGTEGLKGDAGAPGAAGATGPAGAPGATGAPGNQGNTGLTGLTGLMGLTGANAVSYFAAVTLTGALSPTRFKGVTTASHTSTGVYDLTLVGAVDASKCVAIAQVTGGAGYAWAMPDGLGHVAVRTFSIGAAATDQDFVVTVSC